MSPAPSKSKQPPDRTGEMVDGKYKLGKRLGEGGMGAVYEATHAYVGRRFAVKFLHPDLAENEQMLARFRTEARAAGTLENEHIVAVTDFGVAEDGSPYLVMEYLRGNDLRALLERRGRLPVERAVDIIEQACRGLDAAHARGIVHRDLKPDNLFIARRADGSDLAKVLDFGIAKLRSGAGLDTTPGAIMGTLYYMPPEQIRGEEATDHRADVYALGCILYEALTGEVPHPGEETHTVIYHALNEPPIRVDTLRDDLPAGLADVVHRAMGFAPAERYASVLEFAEGLMPFTGRGTPQFRSDAPPSLPRATAEGLAPLPADAPPLDGDRVSPPVPRTRRVRRRAAHADANVERAEGSPHVLAPMASAPRAAAQPAGRALLSTTLTSVLRLDGFGASTRVALVALTGLAFAGGVIAALVVEDEVAAPAAAAGSTTTRISALDDPSTPDEPEGERIDQLPLAPDLDEAHSRARGGVPSGKSSPAEPHDARERVSPVAKGPEAIRIERQGAPPMKVEYASDNPYAAPAAPRAAPSAPTPSGVDLPRAASSRSGCEPPYVVDARGVRRLKPGCL